MKLASPEAMKFERPLTPDFEAPTFELTSTPTTEEAIRERIGAIRKRLPNMDQVMSDILDMFDILADESEEVRHRLAKLEKKGAK